MLGIKMKWTLMGILWIFIEASCGNDSFVFPDETNISVEGKSTKLRGNEESNDFRRRNEFKYVNTGYGRPGGHGHHSHHEKHLQPHGGYSRPLYPPYSPSPGIVNQGYYHRPAESSQANAQANAQASNGYVNSNSQANSQSQSSNYGSPYYPSSASSSASATTGIVNGRPVAAASAAAAAAGAGGSSSSSSGATASGGYQDNSAMSPWFYRNRIASEEVKEEKANNENDKITFLN